MGSCARAWTFVVAPGARSAPLALACAGTPVRRTMRVVHDERAATFYALGHAARSGGRLRLRRDDVGHGRRQLAGRVRADRDSIVVLTADRPA